MNRHHLCWCQVICTPSRWLHDLHSHSHINNNHQEENRHTLIHHHFLRSLVWVDCSHDWEGHLKMRRNHLEVKSKLDAEFRRFSLDPNVVTTFEAFYTLLEKFHVLKDIAFLIFYEDPSHGDLLPINNDENFAKAVSMAKPFLRIILQRKGKHSWSCCPQYWEKLVYGIYVTLTLRTWSIMSSELDRLSTGWSIVCA